MPYGLLNARPTKKGWVIYPLFLSMLEHVSSCPWCKRGSNIQFEKYFRVVNILDIYQLLKGKKQPWHFHALYDFGQARDSELLLDWREARKGQLWGTCMLGKRKSIGLRYIFILYSKDNKSSIIVVDVFQKYRSMEKKINGLEN